MTSMWEVISFKGFWKISSFFRGRNNRFGVFHTLCDCDFFLFRFLTIFSPMEVLLILAFSGFFWTFLLIFNPFGVTSAWFLFMGVGWGQGGLFWSWVVCSLSYYFPLLDFGWGAVFLVFWLIMAIVHVHFIFFGSTSGGVEYFMANLRIFWKTNVSLKTPP